MLISQTDMVFTGDLQIDTPQMGFHLGQVYQLLVGR